MSGPKRFEAYLRVIPKPEREEWITHHLGVIYDTIDRLKAENAKLKARCTRMENKMKEGTKP